MAIEGGTVELVAALGGAAAAATLLGRSKWVVVPGFAILAVAEILLGLSLVTRADLEPAFSSAPRVAAVALCVCALLAATFGFYRFPAWTPVALLVAAPFRVPVGFAGDDVLLLVPLYFVLAAAVLAFVARVLAGAELKSIPLLFAGPAAAFTLLAAASLSWSTDVHNGTIELAFFLLPFSALAAVVARSPFERWTPRALAIALVSLACAFTAVGLWQLRSGDLFFAPDLEVGNAYTTFFRVTSVFKDPSIYGRHLVLAIVVLVTALWFGRVGLLAGSALVAFVWVGLYFSYSQSSMLALAAGVLAVSLVAADARSRRIVLGATAAFVLLAAPVLMATGKDESVRRLTSGRSDLVENAVDVIRNHPLVGVGLGAEARESREIAQAQQSGRQAVAHHTADRNGGARRPGRARLPCVPGRRRGDTRAHLPPARPRNRACPRRCVPRSRCPLALLQRFLRGSAHVGNARRSRCDAPRSGRCLRCEPGGGGGAEAWTLGGGKPAERRGRLTGDCEHFSPRKAAGRVAGVRNPGLSAY